MKKAIPMLFTIALIVYLIYKSIPAFSSLITSELFNNPYKLLLVLIVSGFIYLINVFSWHLLTMSLNIKLNYRDNIRIWMISNLVRLLPGGIWQYPSRVVLMRKRNVDKKLAISAVTIETLLTLSMGITIFLFSLNYWVLPSQLTPFKNILYITIFSPILLLGLTNPKIINLVENLLTKLGKKTDLKKLLPNIELKWFLILLIAFAGRFIVIGVALFILIQSIVFIPLSSLPQVIGMYAISWVFGYLAFFAPGGLGVSENVLSTLLVLLIPFSISNAIALLFRAILFIEEAVFILIALTISKKKSKIKKV